LQPLFIFFSFGMRIRPDRQSGLRFVLAFFVVIGVLITLTYRIVPAGFALFPNNSGWFFAQSKYVARIFAAEVLQTLYRRVVVRGMRPSLAAVALSVPATVQHFALESDPTASTESHWGRS
jgi:hypothetical protein